MARGRPRDSQRGKVYDAEWGLRDREEERLETVGEMQEWVDSITRSRWWKNRMVPGIERVEVRDGRGRRRANGGINSEWTKYGITWSHYGVIKMPRWSRDKMTILHEIAHVMTDYKDGRSVRAHGRMFARNYLALVKRFISYDRWAELRASFKEHGVKYVRVGNRNADHLKEYQFSAEDGGAS